jgi:predicted ATP-binding protein involved in virulence
MHIKELKLHNFRGIKDLHLVFNLEHNVVVLVGINGVGKSSILDCINFLIKYYAIIREVYDMDDESIFFQPARITRIVPDFNEIISLSDIRNGENVTNNSIVLFDCDKNTIEWQLAKFKNEDRYEQWNTIHDKSKENIVNQENSIFINNYFYYLSSRRVIDYTDLTSELNKLPPSAYPYERIETDEIINFRKFSEWFKTTEDLENEQRLSDNNNYRHPQLEAVRQTVYSLLGKGYTSLTFKRAIGKMTIRKLDREIALELLSDGEKNLLSMISNLSRKLSQDNTLDNPLAASALVLIDEIELHLHPSWQRTIIPHLTKIFPNCQFIVTTHSPQVLSHVDPECIHILDYDGDNVVVKRPDSSYGLDSNRILEDILGVSKRPQEIQDRMSELFRTINNNDLEGAKEIVRELGDKIGISEPELVKAEATIKRREIIGR